LFKTIWILVESGKSFESTILVIVPPFYVKPKYMFGSLTFVFGNFNASRAAYPLIAPDIITFI